MRFAIFANTPAQLHFYRQLAEELESRGHRVIFLIRDYRETLKVAQMFDLDFFVYAKSTSNNLSKIWAFPVRILKSIRYLRKFKPDIIMGFLVYDAYAAAIMGKPCIEFQDSEPRVNMLYSLLFKLYLPAVDTVITPELFYDDLGKSQLRIKSFKELAYLHPNYFRPDETILDELGVKKGEDYAILRFNSFDALHDTGIVGFSIEQKKRLVEELSKKARVFISSEGLIQADLEGYTLKIPLHRIHHALYYAKLLVADSQTMVTEAGILGTPAVRCNSFVGTKDMSNFSELEKKYELIYNFSDPEAAIEKARELISRKSVKAEWDSKRKRLLEDKIDITGFMIWYLEEFPRSMKIMRENPNEQLKFR